MKRSAFLKQSLTAGAGLVLQPWIRRKKESATQARVTVLHTADTHSHIDPFPADHPHYPGLGGMARRAQLIQKLRADSRELLLFDSGDIFFGTPYFNRFGGEPELELMSRMGYTAATLGEHDFHNGVTGFERVMHNARFPLVVSNYDFGTTRLGLRVQPHLIRLCDGIKVGIFALGIGFEGILDPSRHVGIRHLDPIETARQLVFLLREYHHCEMVICLSHLGLDHADGRPSDRKLAHEVAGIDLVLGGHSHLLLQEAEIIHHSDGTQTRISHAGHSGLAVVRMDFMFDAERRLVSSGYEPLALGSAATAGIFSFSEAGTWPAHTP